MQKNETPKNMAYSKAGEAFANWLLKPYVKAHTVKDETNANVGTDIVQPLEQAIQLRNEEWQREDAIRAETQAREDTAMQRWVADARAAGINPNLALGATGSPSGGGITSQTGSVDYTMSEAEFAKEYEMLMQQIELKFKGDEAEKDRITNMIKSLITGGSLLGNGVLHFLGMTTKTK